MPNFFNIAPPLKFRGTIRSVKAASDIITYNDVLNISGSGILLALPFRTTNAALTVGVHIIYDGLNSGAASHTGDTDFYYAVPQMAHPTPNIITLISFPYSNGFMKYLNLEFTTSLRIQMKRIGTPAADVEAYPIFILDGI